MVIRFLENPGHQWQQQNDNSRENYFHTMSDGMLVKTGSDVHVMLVH